MNRSTKRRRPGISQAARTCSSAWAKKAFSSSVPTVTRIGLRRPEARQSAHHHALAQQRGGQAGAVAARHVRVHEVGLRAAPGRGPAPASASASSPRARRACPIRCATASRSCSDARAASCAGWLTLNIGRTRSSASATSADGERVAHPQRGQPVDLRERAQHRQARHALAHERDALGLDVRVVGVGLVQHAQHRPRELLEEARAARAGSITFPTGLFGLARQTELRARAAVLHRGQHGVEIGSATGGRHGRPARRRSTRSRCRSWETRATGTRRDRQGRSSPPRRGGSARRRRCRAPAARMAHRACAASASRSRRPLPSG